MLVSTRADARKYPDLGLAADDRPLLSDWLRRPGATIEAFRGAVEEALGRMPQRGAVQTVETELKYSGYLDQQERLVKRMKESEDRRIPEGFVYDGLPGLSREVMDKLKRVGPATLGQAARIPGVTPAAISVLDVYLTMRGGGENDG
jgi:tRNA uridine 5-carboxymethylaminomethyl modification enzyme